MSDEYYNVTIRVEEGTIFELVIVSVFCIGIFCAGLGILTWALSFFSGGCE